MILKGNLVTLRPVEYEDIEFVRGIINDSEIEAAVVGWAWPLSGKDQKKWYESFSNSDKVVRFIIETPGDGPVGFTGLRDIDWKNGVAALAGMRIVRKMRSKGFASDAYKAFLNYAFSELRLHRMNACVLDDNAASPKILERIGFKYEGVQREAAFKNGRYHDVILFSLLDRDFIF